MERGKRSNLLVMVASGTPLLGCAAAAAADSVPGGAAKSLTVVEAIGTTGSSGECQGHSDPRPAAVQAGRDVRVYAEGEDDELEGVFLGADDTALRILEDDRIVTVKRRTIRRIEVASPGRGPTSGKRLALGALIGAAAGLGAGGMAAYALSGGVSGDPNYNAVPAVLTGVAVGAAVGALIAHVTRGHAWTEVPLDQVRVSILPIGQRGGINVALAVRY